MKAVSGVSDCGLNEGQRRPDAVRNANHGSAERAEIAAS